MTIRSVVLVATFVAGVALACQSKTIDNANHCYNAHGDQTCAARFGDQRPYCVGPGDGCDAADEFDGCVAEPPAATCYSPCGQASFAGDDDNCLAAVDEGDTEEHESTSEEAEPEPVCGNGEPEADEECDDGNDIDDDGCTNACTLPICGDGIVQAQLGEACDDGNTRSGDTCTASCELPGTIMWSRTYNFADCRLAGLALRSDDSPAVVVQCPTPLGRLIAFDGDGEIEWEQVVMAGPSDMALGPMDQLTVVGVSMGFEGTLTTVDSDGQVASSVVLPELLWPTGVAVDDAGNIVVGGAAPQGGRFLRRYTAAGSLSWSRAETDGETYFRVATNAAGQAWALRANPPRVETYSVSGVPGWFTGTLGATVYEVGLAVDDNDNVYAVTQFAGEPQGFRIDKFDSDGNSLWSALHDENGVEELAHAVAVLPTGGALVAGYANDAGLLSWYSPDGVHLQDVVYDAGELRTVAVSAEGDFAIAAGGTAGGSAVWLIKVAI